MATTFSARMLYKNDNIRRRADLDFTDDGTKFAMYDYKKTVCFHVARWKDTVFIDIRLGYEEDIPYDVYKDWKEYELCSVFNGVPNDEVDLDKFFENLETIYQKVAAYKSIETAEEDVKEVAEEPKKELTAEQKSKRRAYHRAYEARNKEKIAAYHKARYERLKAEKHQTKG